jgi:hypothetical protein
MRGCGEQTCAADEHPGAKSERSFEASGAAMLGHVNALRLNTTLAPRAGIRRTAVTLEHF